MQWEEIKYCLNQKMQILEAIAGNTETQYRFIQKRELKGLNRVLRERAALIEALAAINTKLANDQAWRRMPAFVSLNQAIAAKEQETINRCSQVMQEAIAEKARIADELRKSRMQRQVRTQYVNPWAIVARGRRINEKG